MTQVNVFEVKAKFAEYLDRAARGERIVIYRYNKPVAELRPVGPARAEPRPVGPVEGRPTFDVPPSFFEPLGEDDLRSWEGVSAADAMAFGYAPHVTEPTAKVAESAATARTKPRRATKRRA